MVSTADFFDLFAKKAEAIFLFLIKNTNVNTPYTKRNQNTNLTHKQVEIFNIL